MTLQMEYETSTNLDMDCEALARQVLQAALNEEQFPYEAEINLVVTDDETIARVNQEFRGIDAATDVLSFPMIPFERPAGYEVIEENETDSLNPDTGEIVLGDIMISADKVIAQAEEYGHSQEREFAFLVTHSLLHLLGYDHMQEEETALMEDKQRQILDQLGICR